MGFNYLKATEPLQRDSLLFTIQAPEVHGTRLIDLGRKKDWVDLTGTQRFAPRTPVLGIHCPNQHNNWKDLF